MENFLIRINWTKEQKENIEQKTNLYLGVVTMENESLRDIAGLGVLILVISAAQLWGALLGV